MPAHGHRENLDPELNLHLFDEEEDDDQPDTLTSKAIKFLPTSAVREVVRAAIDEAVAGSICPCGCGRSLEIDRGAAAAIKYLFSDQGIDLACTCDLGVIGAEHGACAVHLVSKKFGHNRCAIIHSDDGSAYDVRLGAKGGTAAQLHFDIAGHKFGPVIQVMMRTVTDWLSLS